MKNGNAKILLVEDDASLGYVIKDNMEQHELDVVLCADGEVALQAFESSLFDICVLDVMLPKLDGFTLAEKIREKNKDIPIIFLSAKSMKEDKIKGFQLGADDYIVKPFNIEELILRIRVFLKRTQKESTQFVYTLGGYTFNYVNLELTHEKALKRLTQKEADLLKLLCDHKDNMVKREHILKQVWGNDDYFAGRSMDVFISKLRKYLSYDSTLEIINYHGIGFKMITKL
jgi:DNA-binding response OmpR family regulator